MDFFSDDQRRDPYPVYQRVRGASPVVHVPPPFDGWLVFDYEGVKRVLTEHETFSSRVPGPKNWFIFQDPPKHSKLRGLIMRAFTPRVIAGLEPLIAGISRQLLDPIRSRGGVDLATEYAVPLPMKVISAMLGIPPDEWARFRGWSDTILKISYTRGGGLEAQQAMAEFRAVTAEMSGYVAEMIARRRVEPADDLITRLVQAEVDGEQLSHDEVLGFFQLLVVGGQETTANLINNAVLSLLEHRDQLARVREDLGLLPRAIEEVLRYRAPVQWVMRTPTREVQLAGQTVPPGVLVLAMIGSANRDPRTFSDPERFDAARDPNPHLAFGHGAHFCLGAALARMEARIALTDLLTRLPKMQMASQDPWPPRQALNVLGPASLPVRF